jgi:hypothetical protein
MGEELNKFNVDYWRSVHEEEAERERCYYEELARRPVQSPSNGKIYDRFGNLRDWGEVYSNMSLWPQEWVDQFNNSSILNPRTRENRKVKMWVDSEMNLHIKSPEYLNENQLRYLFARAREDFIPPSQKTMIVNEEGNVFVNGEWRGRVYDDGKIYDTLRGFIIDSGRLCLIRESWDLKNGEYIFTHDVFGDADKRKKELAKIYFLNRTW